MNLTYQETKKPPVIDGPQLQYTEVTEDEKAGIDFGKQYGSENDHQALLQGIADKYLRRTPENEGEETISTERVKGVLLGDKPPTAGEVAKAGFDHSVAGLIYNDKKPDTKVLPELLDTKKRLLHQAATLAGDFPFMVAGAMLGAGSTGGNPVGAGMGAFGLPQGLRKVYLDHIEKGEVKTFGDFWDRLTGAVWETEKGMATGGVVSKVGMTVGGLKAVPAEVAAMVGMSSALEMHVPQPEEFLDAAILIGGIRGARYVQQNLGSIFVKVGKRPKQVLEDIENDPTIAEDIANPEVEIPRAYKTEQPKPEQPKAEMSKPEPTAQETAPKSPVPATASGQAPKEPAPGPTPPEKPVPSPSETKPPEIIRVEQELNADFQGEYPPISIELKRPAEYPGTPETFKPAERPAEPGKPALEAPAEQEATPEVPKRFNREFIYKSYQGETLEAKSFQGYRGYKIVKEHKGLYNIVNEHGETVSQRAGQRGAIESVDKMIDEPPPVREFTLKPEFHQELGLEGYELYAGNGRDYGGTYNLSKAKTFVKKLLQVTPEFKDWPELKISEGPDRHLVYDNGKTIIKIRPEVLGVDPSVLADKAGSSVLLDVDAWLAKPFSYVGESKLKIEEKVIGDGWWGDGRMIVGGKTPDRLAATGKSGVETSRVQGIVNTYIAESKPVKGAPRKQADGEQTVVKIGDHFFDPDLVNFLYSNATSKLKFTLHEDGALIVHEHGKPVGLLMSLKPSDYADFKPTREDAALKTPKPKNVKYQKFGPINDPKTGYETPRGTATTGGYTAAPSIMELTDLVQIAKELNAGKYPNVVTKLGNALGMFRHKDGAKGTGQIDVLAKLGKDPHEARMVLGHEIGHLVDWLPDKTLKRGNILGHIAGVKNYLKHFMAGKPGGAPPLTVADRTRLKRIARERLTKKGKQYEIEVDEEIRRELPITPDDVMDIWNSTLAGSKNPKLADYIKRLDTAEKKSIIKEVMRDRVPEEIQQFAEVILEKTGKKVTKTVTQEAHKPTPQEIVTEFTRLFNEEIAKRELISKETIIEELKAVTQYWRPFDPHLDPKFTKYRFSPSELYADAISTLFNAPQMLQRVAPEFYRGFFAYLENRPEMSRVYQQALLSIRDGRNLEAAEQSLKKGFERAEGKYAEESARTNELATKDYWGNALIDSFYSTIRRVKQVGEKTLSPEENPRYAIEDLMYSGSEREGYLYTMANEVTRVAKKEGVSTEDFGLYLYYRRVMSAGDRAERLNPEGFDIITAGKRLKVIEDRLGTEKLEKLAENFHAVRAQYITEKAEAARMHSPEILEAMREYKDYATFDVVDYMEKRYGKEASQQIHAQHGTFKQIANPMTATMLKDLQMIQSINRNIAVESTVKFFDSNFPTEAIVPKKVNHFGQEKLEWPGEVKPKADYELLYFLKDGKLEGRFMPKHITEAFEKNPYMAGFTASILRTLAAPFRAVYVTYRPGFQIYNALRDYIRTAKNVPGANLLNLVPYYAKGMVSAFKRSFGIHDATVKEVLDNKMLVTVTDYTGDTSLDLMNERLLKRYGLSQRTWYEKVTMPLSTFFGAIQRVGATVEGAPKFATNEFLKKKDPGMSTQERAHMVRVRGGSPAFLRRGRDQPILNNLLLFSNAIKEGWRGDIESMVKNPGEYAWKTAQYNMLPKFIMAGMAWGFFGDEVKEIMRRASNYSKTNYTVIPLGMTPGGEGIFFNAPTDDMGRFVGGLTWQGLRYMGSQAGLTDEEPLETTEFISGLFDYTAGQAPGVNPAFGIVGDIATYLGGNNPFDPFYKRHAVEETAFQAGGTESHKQFASSLWNKAGGGIIYKFHSGDPGAVKTELEQIIGAPVLSDTLGRFIKITDYGVREEIRKEKDKLRTAKAQDTVDLRRIVDNVLAGNKLTLEDAEVLNRKGGTSFKRRTLQRVVQRYGNVYLQEFLSAQSKEEKIKVLEMMSKDSRGSDLLPHLKKMKEGM